MAHVIIGSSFIGNAILALFVACSSITYWQPPRDWFYGPITALLILDSILIGYIIRHHWDQPASKTLWMTLFSHAIGLIFSVSVWVGRYEIPNGNNMSDVANMGLIISLIPSTIVLLLVWTGLPAHNTAQKTRKPGDA